MISWWDIWLQLTLISYRRFTFNPFYFSFSPPSLFSGISQPFIYFSLVFLCLHHSHCEQKASLSVFSFTCMSCSFPSPPLFFLLLVLAQWCLSSFFHSFLFDVSFCVCIIYPLFYPFHSFSSLHLYSWASLHYQGVFTSTLLSLSLCLLLFSPLFSSILLFPLSSHFHATHWAATLSVFISVCGRGGSPVPATNGLLENTDSHASQSGELHREKEKEDLE